MIHEITPPTDQVRGAPGFRALAANHGHRVLASTAPFPLAASGRATTARNYNNVTANQLAQDFAAQVATSATIFYIHPDHLNTPRVITNQAQQVVWRWDQGEPFGNSLPNENPSGLGNFTCNLRLPGQYFDKETNLHYNTFRDYDPAIGRYIQSDPIGLAGSINTYAYVDSNPLSLIDLYG